MALVKNNPYPEISDYFGQYQNWKKITLPSGEVVYELPGHPERVFVPSLSNASGKVVLRPNPANDIAKQQEQESAAKKQQQQQEFNQSPVGQLVPVAAGTVGTIAAYKYGIKGDPLFGSSTTPASPPTTQAQAAAQGTATPTNIGKPATPNLVGVERVTPIGSAVMPDGSPGVEMSDGTIISDSGAAVAPDGTSFNVGQYLQGASGALALANAYQQYKQGDKVGAGISAAQGAANVAGALGSSTGTSIAPWLGYANAAYGGYNTLNNDNMTGDEKATRLQQQAGLAVADAYTFGGASALEGMLRKNKTTGKWLGKLDKLDRETNLITMGLGSVLGGPGTREIAKKHTGELLAQGQDDPTYQNYVQGMREQYNSAPPDPSKPFAGGKYGSWDEYKTAGLEANDLTGVYGNIKTYGPAWASLTEDQRRAVTQANIESGLYSSKKGEVEITDESKAKQNFDNVMKGFQAGVQTKAAAPLTDVNAAIGAASGLPAPLPANQSLAAAAASGALKRSTTRSPGIGLNGMKVLYK